MKRYRYSEEEQNLIEKSVIPVAIFQLVDDKIEMIAISKGLCDMLGYADVEDAYSSISNEMFRACHPDDRTRMMDVTIRFMREEGEYHTLFRNRVNEKYRVFRGHGTHVTKDDGTSLGIVRFADEGPYIEGDDTENYTSSISKAVQERTQLHFFNYDYLTGLPNMSYFFELDKLAREKIIQGGDKPAMLFFNLSGMKGYNQKYGFEAGDKLLVEVARVLAKRFGSDNCGRFGGDHFCAIVGQKGLEKRLDDILEELKSINEGRNLPVRVGVYQSEGPLVNPSIACDRAKMASDAIKNVYVSSVNYFDNSLLQAMEIKEYVVTNLDKAMEKGWIQVYHQPIVRAANGCVCDEEALTRWIDPERGTIMPGDFISILEDVKLIYKLDLFVVKQILAKMKRQAEVGIYIVPESVNVSRVDFYTCDIVGEITKLVDEAGIGHDKITIEITESGVATDVEYIKGQVVRLHELGFNVWMDDYGSGYSSPEILQEIHFDTIKLDMQFMRQFSSGNESKIILTELIKMACALGIETVAEGVETVEQVQFLKEVGCTKIQGFYYCPSISVDALFERYEKGIQIGFENPEESEYYTIIGKVSLYDFNLTEENDTALTSNYFNTLPMAILEASDEDMWVVRANMSYREYFIKNFPEDDLYNKVRLNDIMKRRGAAFTKAIIRCGIDGKRVILDERSSDNTITHILIRRIAINPVKKVTAFAVVILGIAENKDASGLTYTYVAQALSSDYIDMFYVDLDTERYIEYGIGDTYDDLAIERHGTDFFRESERDSEVEIYKEDYEFFKERFTKETVIKAIEERGVYNLSYRIMMNGEPVYVHLKAVPIKMKGNSIIIGISNIDAQMKKQEEYERVQEESRTYSRIAALAGNYISIFAVDPDTEHYIRHTTNHEVDLYSIGIEGDKFFYRFVESRKRFILLEDMEYFVNTFTKEKVIATILEHGIFEMKYRILLDNEIKYTHLKANLIEERDSKQLIVGTIDETDQAIREQEIARKLSIANNEVNLDALTGVKNRRAYLDVENQINRLIAEDNAPEFALVVLDINDLKKTNDTLGHQAGDELIKNGCKLICDVFRHCPVFRVGGDEFTVIVQGSSYKNIDKIMGVLYEKNKENKANKDVVVAAGMAIYAGDSKVADVFAKADRSMYENKRYLKGLA